MIGISVLDYFFMAKSIKKPVNFTEYENMVAPNINANNGLT